MFLRLIVAGLALVAAGVTSAANAQSYNDGANWVRIATQQVDRTKDTHTTDLRSVPGRFRAFRLVNKQANMQISNVEVRYADGSVHNERRDINLLEGERTRPIDPRVPGRFADQITILARADTGYRGAPGLIEIWGLQSAAGARATRPTGGYVPPPSANATPTSPAAATGQISASPTTPTPTTARPGVPTDTGEVLFGTQTVGYGVDRDIIRVGAEVGKFDRIRLRVLDNDIHINSMRVIYANGEAEEVAYDANVAKDTRTRWIALKGDRFIKEIQLNYRARPNFRGQAYVEVYGQYAEGWLGPSGEGKKYNAGWVLLGAQTAGFTIDRNDVIKVSKNEGGFRKVRIQVRDQAITMFELRAIYGNGEVDVIPFNRQRIDAGARSAEIDLKGGARILNELRPTYRTRIFQQGGVAKGRAVVEFWGLH